MVRRMKSITCDSHSSVAAMESASHTFQTRDGLELFYRSWRSHAYCNKAIVLLHRGHEHADRWDAIVEKLQLPDAAIFAWDARGHGRSPGDRGWAPSVGTLVQDLDAFVHHLAETHDIPIENMVVVAHSVGAVIAAGWVHDFAPHIRALVLATPAFRVKLYLPGAIPALRLLNKIKRRSFIRSYVGGRLLTKDRVAAEKYDRDPLVSRKIAVNVLLDLFDTSTRLLADAGAIHTPVLLLTAGKDAVVQEKPQITFWKRLSSRRKEFLALEGARHAIFHDVEQDIAVAKINDFIHRAFQEDWRLPSLQNADQTGFTRREYEKLSAPLPPWSTRRWFYAAQIVALKTVGRLSTGIRLGWRTGFDSGPSLDYVYRNCPQGISPLGRWIDHIYLNTAGWRGIRVRKKHLQQLLRMAHATLHAESKAVQIVDIASGPGRYLLETLAELPNSHALLRDCNARGLEEGRQLARELGVRNARFEIGDAFDRIALSRMQPQANLAIVSGLYELFPSNDKVTNSLAGLGELVEEGGFLIYTNQPWHPQVEFIARILCNREGKPWVMRRRTQVEMDELVAEAGFTKTGMLIDDSGIFTVSIARKAQRSERTS